MLVLVGSLGELLGRPEGGGRGLVHRPPVDLQETAGLLQQVTAGKLVTQLVGGPAVCRMDLPMCTATGLFTRVLPRPSVLGAAAVEFFPCSPQQTSCLVCCSGPLEAGTVSNSQPMGWHDCSVGVSSLTGLGSSSC